MEGWMALDRGGVVKKRLTNNGRWNYETCCHHCGKWIDHDNACVSFARDWSESTICSDCVVKNFESLVGLLEKKEDETTETCMQCGSPIEGFHACPGLPGENQF
jgi:hypothetical protein